jgi:hypothetical protein
MTHSTIPHKIISLAPTATITRKGHDWTSLIAVKAPCPDRVTAFVVTEISHSFVAAELTYGDYGTLRLEFWRYRASSDDDAIGHALDIDTKDGDDWHVTSQHHTASAGWVEGVNIREDVPNTVYAGTLALDGDKLIDLMLAVHDRLVPRALIAD